MNTLPTLANACPEFAAAIEECSRYLEPGDDDKAEAAWRNAIRIAREFRTPHLVAAK